MTPHQGSFGLKIDRLRALPLLIRLDLVSDALAFVQRVQSGFFNRRDMYENIPASIVRLDESIALVGVEEFDGTLLRHSTRPKITSSKNRHPDDRHR
jgi:hypothetical protein